MGRYLGHRVATGTDEGYVSKYGPLDAVATFVYQCMVVRAQTHQVIQRRIAAIRPVMNMMAFDVTGGAAPRESTT